MTDPAGLRTALTLAHGAVEWGRKHRIINLAGQTRIYLHRADGLGDLVELEVSLVDHEALEAVVARAERMMAAMAIEPDQLAPRSHVDLMYAGR